MDTDNEDPFDDELNQLFASNHKFRSNVVGCYFLVVILLLVMQQIVGYYDLPYKSHMVLLPALIIGLGIIANMVLAAHGKRASKRINDYFDKAYFKHKNENNIQPSVEN